MTLQQMGKGPSKWARSAHGEAINEEDEEEQKKTSAERQQEQEEAEAGLE